MLLVEGSTVQRPLPSPPGAAAVLLCAATRWEASPIASRLKLTPTGDGLWRGSVAGRPVILLKTGMGPERTAEGLALFEKSLSQGDARLSCVMSIGLAGALQEGMNSGDLVAELHAADAGLVDAARLAAAAQGTPIHFGHIAHTDKLLASPAQKSEFGLGLRSAAVDMESSAVRQWAQRREIPFYAVRAVLDAPGDSLPRAIPQGEDFFSLARYALGNIGELPLMLSTGLKQRNAMAALSSFLEAFLARP